MYVVKPIEAVKADFIKFSEIFRVVLQRKPSINYDGWSHYK